MTATHQTRFGGRYQPQKLIGTGGMSKVYRCLDTTTNKAVAVKVFTESGQTTPILLARFEREILALQQVSHPYIVRLLDYALTPDESYLVMPYFESGSVADRLSRQLYTPQEAVQLLTEIAFALDYAHSQGYFHTDLKPSNLLMDKHGHIYLSDFGLATSIAAHTSITGDGDIFGTPAYMAPELISGAPPSSRTEVYALGVILYELLTGHRPFSAPSLSVLIEMQRTGTPPPASALNSDLPAALDDVPLTALAKLPSARPATAGGFAQQFTRAVLALPERERNTRPAIKPRPPGVGAPEELRTLIFDHATPGGTPKAAAAKRPEVNQREHQTPAPKQARSGRWFVIVLELSVAVLLLTAGYLLITLIMKR
ncbi:MAG TPA: serine/threonine-protein kinase [Aggregatilineales bacterium]|nr:serine/threonine-protein kinase [Aggregatilineales bacterium]